MDVFSFELGQTQGRIEPTLIDAPAGDWVCVLGSELPGRWARLAVGDYVRLAQTGSLTGFDTLRFSLTLLPRTPPAGAYWWFSFEVGGSEIRGLRLPEDWMRSLIDVGANVTALSGDHEIAFQLELRGAGGPYHVELPAAFIDALQLS
jgi:hypothetical protein